MSKILVCLSNAIDINSEYKPVCFYEQLISELERVGNDVLLFIPNKFNLSCFFSENNLKNNIDEEKLKKDINTFNPDFVITFNNACYHDILNITNCPIIIWNSDFTWLWNQKELVKQHVERYHFFCFTHAGVQDIENTFSHVKSTQIHVVSPATSLRKENLVQDKNISFIGSSFDIPHDYATFISNLENDDRLKLREIFKLINENYTITNEKLEEKIGEVAYSTAYKAFKNYDRHYFFGAEKRFNHVNNLLDLGLVLYGLGWEQYANIAPSLVLAFDKQRVYSAKHNQDIYNSSKLCLNSSHPQAHDGIPWRVLDIMATNGCLFTEKSSAIQNLYNGFKIPMFTTPFEGRDLASKLLLEKNWRNDIVSKSQEIIEKEHTWEKRFIEIQQILGINLFSKQTGTLTELEPLFLGTNKEQIDCATYLKEKKLSVKNKLYLKLWEKLDKRLKRKGVIS